MKNRQMSHHTVQTLTNPCSKMKPNIIGTAVNIPIWNKNCALRAAFRAVLCIIWALSEIDASTPDKACKWQEQACKTLAAKTIQEKDELNSTENWSNMHRNLETEKNYVKLYGNIYQDHILQSLVVKSAPMSPHIHTLKPYTTIIQPGWDTKSPKWKQCCKVLSILLFIFSSHFSFSWSPFLSFFPLFHFFIPQFSFSFFPFYSI